MQDTEKPKTLITFKNLKIMKGEKYGYLTGILHLAPANLSGHEVCPFRSAGCTKACLNTSGHGRYSNVQQARLARTRFFFEHNAEFYAQLQKEIDAAKRKARRLNLTLAVRLNGTSDLPVLARKVAAANPDIIFYDYTKIPKPWERELENYRLTFSLSENNMADALDAIDHGINVAVVFSGELPETWHGYKVVNGEDSDLRFLDPRGVIVGLTAKAKAKRDTSGFVQQSRALPVLRIAA